jgi:hypothetical protein
MDDHESVSPVHSECSSASLSVSDCTCSIKADQSQLEKSVNYGVQSHSFRVRKPMTGSVQMTKLSQVHHEEGQKQEQKHMKYQKDSRCLM